MKKNKLNLDDLEWKLFNNVTPKIVSHLKWRYFYFPLMILPFLGLLSYFGVNHLIESKVNSGIKEEIKNQFTRELSKIDSLCIEADSLVNEEKQMLTFFNNQLNVFMRQYELILPLIAYKPEALKLTEDIGSAITNRYAKLENSEGLNFKLKQIGVDMGFSFYLYKLNGDSLYLVFEIPTDIVAMHFDQLNGIGYMKGLPIPVVHRNVTIRSEAFFQNMDLAISDIIDVTNVIFGIDKIYDVEISSLKMRP